MEVRMLYVIIGMILILGIVFLFLGNIYKKIFDRDIDINALRDTVSVKEYSMKYTCSKSGSISVYHINVPYLKIKNNGNRMASVTILFKIGDSIKLGSGDCGKQINLNPRSEAELFNCFDGDFESYKNCPGTSDLVDDLDVVFFDPNVLSKCPEVKKGSYAYLLQKCGDGYIIDTPLKIENGEYIPVVE